MFPRHIRLSLVALAFALTNTLLAYAQAPCTPTVTTKTSVLLEWDKAVPPPGATELAYVLEWKEDNGPWTVEPAPTLTATQYSDTANVGKTTTWRLRVQRRLADGTVVLSDYATYGAKPPCVQVVTVLPPTSSETPTNFSATPQ